MSNAPSSTGFATNLGGTYYGLMHLALASAAYTYEAFPLSIATEFASFIPTLPPVPDIAAGYWSVEWGPALCTGTGGLFNDNLAAIISYRTGTSPNGTPAFFAVLCRGTDVAGDIAQIAEDFDAFTQQTWVDVVAGNYTYGGVSGGTTVQTAITNPPSTLGVIATGSANALIAVTNLVPYSEVNSGTYTYLAPALMTLLKAYPGTPVVVTGHSLGGAITQVVSAYLCSYIDQEDGVNNTAAQVIAQAFAPPTVGDSVFASFYSGLLTGGQQYWVNNFDIVPCGFANLGQVGGLWGGYVWPQSPTFGPTMFGTGTTELDELALIAKQATAVQLVEDKLAKTATYARPANPQLMSLNDSSTLPSQAEMEAFVTAMGANPASWSTWGVQLEYQHFIPAYYALVSKVSGVVSYPYVSLPPVPSTF